jgi:hypothetical protein
MRRFVTIAAALALLALLAAPAYANHPRPRGATPFRTSLVPAYKQCTAPNRSHGAPLDYSSCNPPQQTSDYLTLGTMDANGQPAESTGVVKFAVRPQDVLLVFVITDVRNKSDLSDYTGGLQEVVNWRLTDHYNGPSLTESATMLDIPFPANMPCGTTITDDGAICGMQTSVNAIVPGTAKAGQRAVVELGQVLVYDGGADGDPATAPNTLFLDQGIFVP